MVKATPQIPTATSLTNQFYAMFPQTLRDSLKAKPNEFMPNALKAKFDAVLSQAAKNKKAGQPVYTRSYEALKQELQKLIPTDIQKRGDNLQIIDDFAKQYTDNYLIRRQRPFYELKQEGKNLGLATAGVGSLGLTGLGAYTLVKGSFGRKPKEQKGAGNE